MGVLFFVCILMARLKTNGRRKLRMALIRVDKVVVMDVKRSIEQQRKWKAKVMAGRKTHAN